jgi:alpha-tubulin suppressor-like RCC1 family protein
VSAWHSSAAITEKGELFVWGSGIYGEFKKPRQVKLQNDTMLQSVTVGGSFIVLVDKHGKAMVWGANSNGEIGVGDLQVRSHPTILDTIEDKIIFDISVGSCFAFAIGKITTRMETSVFDETLDKTANSLAQQLHRDTKNDSYVNHNNKEVPMPIMQAA